jgi:choline dehydrogenase
MCAVKSQDYDRWRQMGNTGWVGMTLPLFKRSRKMNAVRMNTGNEGPLSVSNMRINGPSRMHGSQPRAAGYRSIQLQRRQSKKASVFQLTTHAMAVGAARRSQPVNPAITCGSSHMRRSARSS